MHRHVCFVLVGLILISLISTQDSLANPGKSDPAKLAFFETKVKPILEANCFKCHGRDPSHIKGGLFLTSRANILRGGDRGPAADPANVSGSLILKMINYSSDQHRMPPKGKLPQDQIDIVTQWVKDGLAWTPDTAGRLDSRPKRRGTVTKEDSQYWCYQPVRRPDLPQVKSKTWIANPIDVFILEKLEAKGLTPNGQADKVALMRRAHYDLTGLPPTPAEVEAYMADDSADAYEKLVDRLLAGPQYGEKWGRHWLDLVRYAETHGYERDSAKPEAWRYRDYVIDAFNSDKPYDRFVMEQIAGDELDEVTSESMTATGFYRLGIWDDEPADRLLAKYDGLDDMVSTVGSVFLGMSIRCARCHEHKGDPIPHEDYYRLLSFFHNIKPNDRSNLVTVDDPDAKAKHQKQLEDRSRREHELHSKIFATEQQFKSRLGREYPEVEFDRRPATGIVDLKYRFYRDTFARLPKFDELRPETVGELPDGYISLSPASRGQSIGLVFEGRLQVPEEGTYVFTFKFTEGFRLIVNGKVLGERDRRGQVVGTAFLGKGLVPIRVEFFNNEAKPVLDGRWSGPNFDDRPLTAEAVKPVRPKTFLPSARVEPRQWQYTTSKPGNGWMDPGFETDSNWKKALGGFGRAGTPGLVHKTNWHSSDIWLRREFDVRDVPGSLTLDIYHDEDATVYLNGRQVARLSGYVTKYVNIPLDAPAISALKPGRNVLAIHCKQTGGGQGIDAGLLAKDEHTFESLLAKYGPDLLGAKVVKELTDARKALDQLRKSTPTPPGIKVMAVSEAGRSNARVLLRGNPHVPDKEVAPGIPKVLGGWEDMPIPTDRKFRYNSSGRRRVLAEWMVSRENPLTARVMVNRFWQHHFGRGIVETTNDFGKLGLAPTHQGLLDWLAAEFMETGWGVKRMHKLIMMSNAYRMSSVDDAKSLAADPGNELFWRFGMRRLTAEEIRDSILAVNGSLNLRSGGPSIYPPIAAEVLATASRPGAAWKKSSPEEAARRSVYIFVKRSLVFPMLSTFDLADTDQTCAVRFATTVPTQSLTMLNSKFMDDQAALFADRLKREAGDDVRKQVSRAWWLTTQREPSREQIDKSVELIESFQRLDNVSADVGLKYFCLMALNLNEFVYLD